MTTRGERLSNQETENLAEFLRIGMSIKDKREVFAKEVELAEIKQKIREIKRHEHCGAIGNSICTTIGASFSSHGGLSFN